MKAIDIIIKSGRATSMAEAKRILHAGLLKINGTPFVAWDMDKIHETNIDLIPTDKITIGNKEVENKFC